MEKYHIMSNEDLVKYAIEGVNPGMVEDLVEEYGISRMQIALYMGINERTVKNYQKQRKAFDPEQGEKLLKIGRLMKRGTETFGNQEAFKRWLVKPSYGLDNKIPEKLLITSEGINLVFDEVERIAFGDLA